MSLIKCTECNHQISKDAEACPSCGHPRKQDKPKKKTSLKTWFFSTVIGLYFVGFCTSQISGVKDQSATSKIKKKSSSSRSAASKPKWGTSSSLDEMTQEQTFYASSPSVSSIRPMEFPYNGVKSWIGVGCSSKSFWVYFGFDKAPNLNNTDTEDGYNRIRTRVKWDKKLEDTNLTQKWGSKFLHFSNKDKLLGKLKASKNVTLELDWHGQNRVLYKYSLNGSSSAINKVFSKCGL